jgi:hypothetical protein
LYSGDNAWTDASGALHMRMTKKTGRWSCAQVVLNRRLGYGTYTLVLRDTSHLEPAAVFSMYTFDQWAGDQHYREMDVEISRWGNATNRNNAQYGLEPFYVPGHIFPFKIPSGTVTHSMHWESARVSFKTARGVSIGTAGPLISSHEFISGV